MDALPACVCTTCMPSTHGGQKRVFGTWETDGGEVVMDGYELPCGF